MPQVRYFAPIDFKARFPALDGVRAIAVLLVFAVHYGGNFRGGPIVSLINAVRERGWVGVDLFFVLSGFLITGILYDTRTDSHYFKRFFARRSLRIFPVFYLVVILLLLLTPVFDYQWRWGHLSFLVYLGNIFGNIDPSLFYVQSGKYRAADASFGHFWSLCVEEQFYMLWPLAVWFIRDRMRLLWTAAGFSLLALVLRIAMVMTFSHEVWQGWIARTLPFRMDSLLFGAMLALVLRGPLADRWQRSSKWIFLTAAMGIVTMFWLSPSFESPWVLSLGLTLIAMASAGLVGCTLRPQSPSFKLFYWKPLRILGKYSYGFYIYHVIFRAAWIHLLGICEVRFHSVALARTTVLICNLTVTFLVAKLSYDWFEVRFLRYKHYFEYDSELTEHKHAFTTEASVAGHASVGGSV